MSPTEQLEQVLQAEPLLRVVAKETFRRGDAKIIRAMAGGALILDRSNEAYMLLADTENAALTLFDHLPQEVSFMTNDYLPLDEKLIRKYGFTVTQTCFSLAYQKNTPVEIDTHLRLLPLSENDAPFVHSHYPAYGLEGIRETIKKGRLLGGYVGDTLVGFIGWHGEGSMGLLHVLKEHRKQGHAFAMEAQQINLMLSQGRLPFGQVETHNLASLALQRKLGMTVSERTMTWMFRKENQ